MSEADKERLFKLFEEGRITEEELLKMLDK